MTFWWFAYEMKDNIWIAFARDHVELHLTGMWTAASRTSYRA